MRPYLGVLLLCSSTLLSSSGRPVFTKSDLAYYADAAVVNFVRPGLVLKITGASVAADGTIQAQFTLTDPQGLPLDRAGVTTPGAVSTSFVASYIPKGQTDYISLIARAATGAVSGTVNQPATDSGGSYTQTGDGQYTYTFAAKAPAGFDATQTVSIGMWASRDLSQFQLGTNAANAVLTFVPGGGAPVDVHDVVHTAACNKCHDPLGAHGGVRREVALCVMCHNPGGNNGNLTVQTVDPDTGNSIDFKVLIHKIHMGSSLPSVQSGHPYQIIGFNNSVNDFSGVVYPADARNCQMCHENGAPPQAACGLPARNPRIRTRRSRGIGGSAIPAAPPADPATTTSTSPPARNTPISRRSMTTCVPPAISLRASCPSMFPSSAPIPYPPSRPGCREWPSPL